METLRNASVPSEMLGHGVGGLERVDIRIDAGKIAGIAAHAPGAGRDLDGCLVVPTFADIHTHIDKGHIWPRKPNPDGTFMGALDAVQTDRERRWSAADVRRRMEFSLRCAYAHGTAAIRTHIDSPEPQGEVSWPVFAEMRDAWRDRIALQGVSLFGPDEMLDLQTLRRIAELTRTHGGILGGAIASHPQSAEATRNVVVVAGEFGLDLDLHCDETLDPGSRSLFDLANAVIETGYAGRVIAGHCCSLSMQDEDTQRATISRVAEAGVAIVSLPMCNMYLQDRDALGQRTPMHRGVTLVRELATAGVPVALASDNTRDPFYPYGDLDPLEVLREGVRTLHLDHPQDEAWTWFQSVTGRAATIAGFDHAGGIAVGAPADLVIFRARDWTELLSRSQSDRQVLRGGEAIDTTLPDFRELDDLMEA